MFSQFLFFFVLRRITSLVRSRRKVLLFPLHLRFFSKLSVQHVQCLCFIGVILCVVSPLFVMFRFPKVTFSFICPWAYCLNLMRTPFSFSLLLKQPMLLLRRLLWIIYRQKFRFSSRDIDELSNRNYPISVAIQAEKQFENLRNSNLLLAYAQLQNMSQLSAEGAFGDVFSVIFIIP